MFMYLSSKDFNINKERLEILENRDPSIIICFLSSKCHTCKMNKPLLYKLPDIFPTLKFGIINVDKNREVLDIFKKSGIIIDRVPFYVLFKIGVYDRTLNLHAKLNEENIREELNYELDTNKILPNNSERRRYMLFDQL